MNKINQLPPFKKFCVTIGNLPSSYVDSMSYYECLLWLCNYLKTTVVPTVNDTVEAVTELQNYVANYFDNLDVQEEVDNKLDEMVESGELAEIILQKQYVTPDQFKEDDDVDDTASFVKAIEDGRTIYLLPKTYTVSSTLTLDQDTHIIGRDKLTSKIEFSDDSDYLFEYKSEVHDFGAQTTNIVLDNFSSSCKNFIKLNDNELTDANWLNQKALLGVRLSNLYIIGKYIDTTDSNKNTNVLPELSALFNFGVGINASTLFDSIIENCNIRGFGLGLYLKGCDINAIQYNRFELNGCHIFTDRISTFGSQNRIIHNDIIHNYRYGGIRINGTAFDTIEDNYFETYTAAACEIYAENERQLSIINNRIDNPQVNNIDVIRVNPEICDIIIDNRINPNVSYNIYCNILHEHLNYRFSNCQNSAIFKNNNGKLLLRNSALVKTDNYNGLIVSPYNNDIADCNIGGTAVTDNIVLLDDTLGLYYFNNTGTAGVTRLDLQFKDLYKKNYVKVPTIKITYKSTGAVNQYAQIADGSGNVLFQGNIAIDDDGDIHTVEKEIETTSSFNGIIVRLPITTNEILAVELI